jgi:hypothetical protein
LREPEVESEMKRSADRGTEAKSVSAIWSREGFRDREKFLLQCRSAIKNFGKISENCSECRMLKVLIDGIMDWLESRGWSL